MRCGSESVTRVMTCRQSALLMRFEELCQNIRWINCWIRVWFIVGHLFNPQEKGLAQRAGISHMHWGGQLCQITYRHWIEFFWRPFEQATWLNEWKAIYSFTWESALDRGRSEGLLSIPTTSPLMNKYRNTFNGI